MVMHIKYPEARYDIFIVCVTSRLQRRQIQLARKNYINKGSYTANFVGMLSLIILNIDNMLHVIYVLNIPVTPFGKTNGQYHAMCLASLYSACSN